MQTITANQKQHLYEGGYVGVTITVTPITGSPFTITEDDIIEGSFSIERNWALGSNIEIGCADTSELIFTLDNSDGQWSNVRWEGAQLTVVLDIDGEPLQAGIFTVDEPPRKLTTMQIKALDDMAKFNRPYNTDLEYPASLLQIIQDACSKCNVTLGTVNFTNKEYVVGNRPEGQDITYHHIVAWVAELAGTNAWIDHLRRLQLSWYGDNQTGDLEISPDDMMVYNKMAESDITITGIVFYPSGSEQGFIAGTDDYALVIEGNPLLQDNIAAVLSNIYTKIGGFTYRPYEIETLGYPHLWPGDIITTLTDVENNEHTSIITNHIYKLNSNSKLQAKGETQSIKGYATGSPFTPSQKRILQTVAKIEASRQTSSLEQAVLRLNELMSNALGFYTTTLEVGGAKKVYIHDKPELEESQVIWTMTEMGLAWTDQGWNDGDPVWHYGITSDGSLIVKLIQAIGIMAEWIIVNDQGDDLITYLQAMDGRIESKVSQTEVQDLETGLLEHISNQIEQTVSDLTATIEQTVADAEGPIREEMAQMQLKVNEFDLKFSTVENINSDIEDRMGQVEEKTNYLHFDGQSAELLIGGTEFETKLSLQPNKVGFKQNIGSQDELVSYWDAEQRAQYLLALIIGKFKIQNLDSHPNHLTFLYAGE